MTKVINFSEFKTKVITATVALMQAGITLEETTSMITALSNDQNPVSESVDYYEVIDTIERFVKDCYRYALNHCRLREYVSQIYDKTIGCLIDEDARDFVEEQHHEREMEQYEMQEINH